MKKKRKQLPPLCRPGHVIKFRLTKGQEHIIKQSYSFHLCGRDYTQTVKFWMIRGIEDSICVSPARLAALKR